MTAIFAYAYGDTAFVAGDTCRTALGGVRYPDYKVHRWSEHVLLAQAGEAQHLTDLIHMLLAKMSAHAPTDSGFIKNFSGARQPYWEKVQQRYGSNKPPAGTVLVVSAADAQGPARITELDFETAMATPITGRTHAHGTLAPQFQQFASTTLQNHGAAGQFQLDRWGASCVDHAVAAATPLVGWPADLLVSRRASVGRLTIGWRVPSTNFIPEPSFLA